MIYEGSEDSETTDMICAVILANDADFVNGVQGVFNNIGIGLISASILPFETADTNAATGKICTLQI